jgi:predicted RND superfamily exporter protein
MRVDSRETNEGKSSRGMRRMRRGGEFGGVAIATAALQNVVRRSTVVSLSRCHIAKRILLRPSVNYETESWSKFGLLSGVDPSTIEGKYSMIPERSGFENRQEGTMTLRWCRLITRHPVVVLATLAALTLLSVSRIIDLRSVVDGRLEDSLRLQIDPSLNSLLPSEDASRDYYERVREVFGSDETLVLVIHSDSGVYEADFLEALERTTERVEVDDAVSWVLSLANAPNIRSQSGDLVTGPFFRRAPTERSAIDAIQSQLEANPIYAGSLVSEDGQTAAIRIYLEEMSERDFTREGVDHRLRQIADEEFAGRGTVALIGAPRLKAEVSRTLVRDILLIVPIVFLLTSLIAYVSYRTIRGVVIPAVTIALALIWSLGLAAELAPQINVVTISVPALVLVVGFAYAVHMVSAYYDVVEEGAAGGLVGESAAFRGLHRVLLPTFLTGLTTGVGFLSVATSSIEAVRDFGIHCALGVGCTMLAAITFAPATMQLLKEPAPRTQGLETAEGPFEQRLRRLGWFDVRHRGPILFCAALVVLVSGALATRIQVSTDLGKDFSEDTDVARSLAFAKQKLGVVDQIFVVFEAGVDGALLEPANLSVIEELQAFVDDQPEVAGSTSVVDYVKLVNRAMNEDDAAHFRVPDQRRTVGQLLLIGATEQLDRLVDPDHSMASVEVRIGVTSSADLSKLVERIEAEIARLPPVLDVHVTGNPVLIANTTDDIALGQTISLATAFLVILVILSLFFTSLRIGLLAMLPNALPVCVYFGALGATGIPLSLTTGSVACLVIGIAVDDTIHFLSRFNALARELGEERSAVPPALVEVGRPVTYTSIALCLGFLILSLAELQSLADFGTLAAFTLAVAWVADLTFTPALAAGIRVVTLWDIVALNLGDRPERAIPLFRGLSVIQTRITALMLDVVERPAGERLISKGEESDGMYAILSGRMVSWVERDGKRIELNVHERGDVVGEVGIFRGARSANVDCETDMQLVWFGRAGLDRLLRRYPRIGAKVLRNLSEILAERLVRATDRVS